MTITPQPGYTQTEWLLTKLCSISSFKVMFYGFIWNQHSNQFPWVARSFGRALHQYRRGHRFKSRTGLNFFQVLFSLLLKQCSLLRTSLSYSRLYPQFTYMIFIYSQSFIYHFTGLYGTNINSQLACQLSWQSTVPVSPKSQVQIPYRPEFVYFLGLIFTTAQVVFITAKIAFIFTSLSAVHIYDFHIFTVKLKKTVQLHPQSPICVRIMVSASVNTCIEISLFKCDLTGLNEVEMIEILL